MRWFGTRTAELPESLRFSTVDRLDSYFGHTTPMGVNPDVGAGEPSSSNGAQLVAADELVEAQSHYRQTGNRWAAIEQAYGVMSRQEGWEDWGFTDKKARRLQRQVRWELKHLNGEKADPPPKPMRLEKAERLIADALAGWAERCS